MCGKLGVIGERKNKKRKEILVKPHRRKKTLMMICIGISDLWKMKKALENTQYRVEWYKMENSKKILLVC